MYQYDFNSRKYWEKRYQTGGNSGAGSYNHLAKFKASVVNDFIKAHDINNVLEFGCGDGNNLALYNIANYIGIDISITAINICKEKFVDDISKFFFTIEQFAHSKKDFCEKIELVLSLDVIYHLIEDDVFDEYMGNLFNSSSKYIMIYASNFDEILSQHVKHRKFTNWIEKNRPDWKLKEFIKNKYPYDKNNPKNTSFADFYIFEKTKQ
jgi:SAM-dependent methyltransferase